MTAPEQDFLNSHGGVEPVTRQQLADLEARSTARLTAEAVHALSRAQVAALLGVDPSRISHQVSAGQLYSYPGPGRQPMFPDWQIVTRASTADTAVPADRTAQKARDVPHLSQVIGKMPGGAHPVAVRSFMTTPTLELTSGDGVAMAPVDWLLSGGEAGVVSELAATLGEQV